jgi:hypothetical protein
LDLQGVFSLLLFTSLGDYLGSLNIDNKRETSLPLLNIFYKPEHQIIIIIMSSKAFEAFYREIFADLTVSREESAEIKQKFVNSNPPPDKLVWLRSSAFRIGSEFLSDDESSNISLLKSINSIVHSLEFTCMM